MERTTVFGIERVCQSLALLLLVAVVDLLLLIVPPVVMIVLVVVVVQHEHHLQLHYLYKYYDYATTAVRWGGLKV